MADESKRMDKSEIGGNKNSTSALQPIVNSIQLKKEIKEQQKAVREFEKEIIKLKKAEREAEEKGQLDILKQKRKEREEAEKSQRELQEELNKSKEENAKKIDEIEKESRKAWGQLFLNLGSTLKDNLDKTMASFLETQEIMAYNLNGTGRNLQDVTRNLNEALAGTGIVRQEKVYNNLSNLIKEGIVFNAEQRAYLQTLSEDLGMKYYNNIGDLTRLINLQRKDLSSNRMAIEYSLKEFLNQNYQTSQYIKEGFEGVSQALIEAQSLMASNTAMELEAVLQQWMGSLSSVGMSSSTIQNLATAIGQLGAGDISGLSSNNMQNLLVMGASVAGKSYADLLTNGLTADTANELMQGIVSYIAGMANNTSNVVKSEYGRIFGLSVSDIVAASQVGNVTENGFINDDISNLLGNMNNYLYFPTQLENMLSNLMYN